MIGNFFYQRESKKTDNDSEQSVPAPVVPKPIRPGTQEDSYPTFLKKPIEGLSHSEFDSEENSVERLDFIPSETPVPVVPRSAQNQESVVEQPQIENEGNQSDLPEEQYSVESEIEKPIIPSFEKKTEEKVLEKDIPPVSKPMEEIEDEILSTPNDETEKTNLKEEIPLSDVSENKPEEQMVIEPQESSDESVTESDSNTEDKTTDNVDSDNQSVEGEKAEESEIVDYKSESFLSSLFENNNVCVTAPNGSFPIKDDTRALLVLFSNGRFFVAETARFDGKVLGFEYLARRRRLQIGKPEYVPSLVINDIYEYANKNSAQSFIPPTVEATGQEQVRMQRDFVTIISRAAMNKVSDIHVIVADHTTVMFRVNGLMQTEMEYNREWGESFVRAAFASADISDANYAQNEYQAAQKLGRTPLRGSGGKLLLPRNVLGIRLQFNPIAFGSRYVVMRLLYAEDDMASASNLEALGFTSEENKIFFNLRAVPTGMIVISGPTGSGKSTTLQRNMIAMLQERNYEINLITVEDPPEYPIPGARQMPVTNAMVEEAKEREFTKALSAALRSDPDALMIGEIRTLSAADLAFRGALSGHNVWTTLHANSAAAVLMRLKDIGVENFKLQDPSIMRGLMAQRLFRKVCPHCHLKAKDNLNHPAVQRLKRAFGDVAVERCFLRGSGCEECDHRGVKGRTVVGEFIMPDATFLDLSLKGEFKKAQNYWINDLGGKTLRDMAITRMLKGEIDIEEVEKWTGFLDQQIGA